MIRVGTVSRPRRDEVGHEIARERARVIVAGRLDLGADSLEIAELVMALEEEFRDDIDLE